jgi:small subunit ribosomal protein S1
MTIKKRFTTKFIDDSSNDFMNLLEQHNANTSKDALVKGLVVSVTKDIVVVDVGFKDEGRVPRSEFDLDKSAPPPQVGDYVDVYIDKNETRNGRTIVSREKAIRQESWKHLEKALAENQLVDGVIFGRVKGGFAVDVQGVVAFLPGSQLDIRPIKNADALIGIVQSFQILKMDNKLDNIVVSRKAVIASSASEAKEEMLSKVVEGMILKGVVKNILDYGAFIDLGSVDGLLHVTDIAWKRVNHPSEILTLGKEVDVKVIKFDKKTQRISLGMKQIDDSPWKEITESFQVGMIANGKVTNITDYGAFVELKNGIEGLVHSSEISWTKVNNSPKKCLTIGQEIQFKILEIDQEKQRISLSIKQCSNNPWEEFAKTHPLGSVLTVPVKHITDFGIFVSLTHEIDGLIHESDLSWEVTPDLLKSHQKGDMVTCKVLVIDLEKERINLGVKQLLSESSTNVQQEIESNIETE